jgi:hypothetical protein
VEKAASIVKALAPEIIVASAQDAYKLRDLALANGGIPIIAVGEETRVTAALIEEVRRTLRDRIPQA